MTHSTRPLDKLGVLLRVILSVNQKAKGVEG